MTKRTRDQIKWKLLTYLLNHRRLSDKDIYYKVTPFVEKLAKEYNVPRNIIDCMRTEIIRKENL